MTSDQTTPEVSVIVPVYKVERYLESCVRSILAQTFTDFELILVDDASPDRCGQMCDDLAREDARIRVFHRTDRGGLSAARNTGLEHATGKYIMFCDSDDYVLPEWIETLHGMMEKEDIEVAACGKFRIETDDLERYIEARQDGGAAIALSSLDKSAKSDDADSGSDHTGAEIFDRTAFFELYKKRFMTVVWDKIYIGSIIREKYLQFDESLKSGEDRPFNCRYIRYVKKIGINRNRVYVYRQNPESIMHTYAENTWDIEKKIHFLLKDTIIACGIDFDTVSSQYYNEFIVRVDGALSNNMMPGSGRSFADRFLENCRILRSPECKEAWKNGAFPSMRPISRLIWKTRFYPLIWLYPKLVGALAHKK